MMTVAADYDAVAVAGYYIRRFADLLALPFRNNREKSGTWASGS